MPYPRVPNVFRTATLSERVPERVRSSNGVDLPFLEAQAAIPACTSIYIAQASQGACCGEERSIPTAASQSRAYPRAVARRLELFTPPKGDIRKGCVEYPMVFADDDAACCAIFWCVAICPCAAQHCACTAVVSMWGGGFVVNALGSLRARCVGNSSPASSPSCGLVASHLLPRQDLRRATRS